MLRNGKYSIHLFIIFFYMAQSSFNPFLSYWFMEQGLTNQQIGLLFSFGPIIGLFSQPMWGYLSDRYGIEKRILMICIFLSPIIAFGYMAAGQMFVFFILTALVYAVFYSAITPISDVLTVNHAERHGQSYGSIRVLGSISFGLAVIPIGFLYNWIGINAMFLANFVIMMAAFVMVSFIKKSSGDGLHKRPVSSNMLALIKKPIFSLFLVFVFFVSIGNHFSHAFFAVFIGHLGGKVSESIGILNSISALSELPFFILSAYLIRRFGFFNVFFFTSIAAALRWWILSIEPSFSLLMLSQLLHGFTFALFMAAGVNFAYKMSPVGMKNTGQTIFVIVNANAASIIASNGGGWIVDQYNFSTLFRVGAILCLVGAAGFMMMSILYRNKYGGLHTSK